MLYFVKRLFYFQTEVLWCSLPNALPRGQMPLVTNFDVTYGNALAPPVGRCLFTSCTSLECRFRFYSSIGSRFTRDRARIDVLSRLWQAAWQLPRQYRRSCRRLQKFHTRLSTNTQGFHRVTTPNGGQASVNGAHSTAPSYLWMQHGQGTPVAEVQRTQRRFGRRRAACAVKYAVGQLAE